MLPYSSQQGAAMKATSIFTLPSMMERARPPWVLTTMGQESSPRLASSPIRPLTPHWNPAITPLLMCGMISACTGCTEEEAIQIPLSPMAAISATIRFKRKSPFLKL